MNKMKNFMNSVGVVAMMVTGSANALDTRPTVVVIGSGPAGLMAALTCARLGVTTKVIRGMEPGGLLLGAGMVENMPGMAEKRGYEIMNDFMQRAEKFGAEMIDDEVVSIDDTQRPFVLACTSGTEIKADALIVATGSAPRHLGVPGENEYWGRGVTSCAVCDCFLVKDKHALIVGGGDSAIEHALHLAHYADKITMLVRGEHMRASEHQQKKLDIYRSANKLNIMYSTDLVAIEGNGERVQHVMVLDKKTNQKQTLEVAGIFLAIGHVPNSSMVPATVAKLPDGTILLATRSQQTTVSGIFAAGDVADNKFRQAGIAAGAGQQAGMEAVAYVQAFGGSDV